ncbi:MAG TPA: phenylalanine--tRNA ligase subunit beta [Solirubrobacterales bacterium]|nr:phenylalanine--tRNA ligase subunit beta [Solirubrobacterales bacterium]
MRVPLSWLREYCDPGLEAEELADGLAMRTAEVERISQIGPPAAEKFVVGRVISAEQHPDADRLRVCEVDAGDGLRTIVCGAPNVAVGQTVAVALPGAVMPDGMELGRAKLRGIESNGMILSEAEMEVGEDAAGIAVLARDGEGPAPGTPLADVLPIAERVVELEVNSNRVDCFGVYGVAREVHAITGAPLAEAPWIEDAPTEGDGEAGDYASVRVEVPELCPRFTARVFTDVTIGPSPLWLKARLIAAGQRPINNVVDITNYVMLLTAQPLHAFDLDKVPGGELIVRRAADGEAMTTLDGVERRFDPDVVLVCDREGPSGIAGVMGSARSEVSDTTTRVLLEVATWDGVNVLRTSRRLGLRTEASNRFEKQLHPELATWGQRVASKLLVELCGARLVPGTLDEAADVPTAHTPSLRTARAEALLGMTVEASLCEDYLRRLGFTVDRENGDIRTVVPFHRHYDVSREVDLIEEVGRIHGYDEHLASSLPDTAGQTGGLTRDQSLRRRAEDVMRDLGFDSLVTLSLTDPEATRRLRIPEDDPRGRPIRISNPLSLEFSRLRTTLFASLLDAARYNLDHAAERVAVFESGRAYLAEGRLRGEPHGGEFSGARPAPAHEPHRIGALAIGPLAAPGWTAGGGAGGFYALKGVLEALARQLGSVVEVQPGEEPFLHPGRCGEILVAGEPAGWIGEVHPLVARAWDLDAATGFEVDLAPLLASSTYGRESYEDVISYPAVHQDLAVVVAEDVPAAGVSAAVMAGGGDLLRSAEIFDVYRGDQLGEGRKSLALRLEFRAPDRTLTDEEVAEVRERIRSEVEGIGGSLRE